MIDADAVAREVTEPGEPAPRCRLSTLRAGRPGDRTARSTGRRSPRSCSPTRPRSATLEAIIHPLVRPRILAAIADRRRAAAPPAVVIEAIKLVEGGYAGLCDEVWLVTCDPAAQRARLAGRGIDPAATRAADRGAGRARRARRARSRPG